jgi:hypothetical protein
LIKVYWQNNFEFAVNCLFKKKIISAKPKAAKIHKRLQKAAKVS